MNTLTFFWGDSSMPANFVQQLMINLTLYPDKIYGPPVRALMYSLIPVGLAVHTPLRLLKTMSQGLLQAGPMPAEAAPPLLAAGALLGSILFCALAARFFYAGLKRYESGNQIVTRL
jgi:ABC-type uncharacterized transport system permease subunit